MKALKIAVMLLNATLSFNTLASVQDVANQTQAEYEQTVQVPTESQIFQYMNAMSYSWNACNMNMKIYGINAWVNGSCAMYLDNESFEDMVNSYRYIDSNANKLFNHKHNKEDSTNIMFTMMQYNLSYKTMIQVRSHVVKTLCQRPEYENAEFC